MAGGGYCSSFGEAVEAVDTDGPPCHLADRYDWVRPVGPHSWHLYTYRNMQYHGRSDCLIKP